MKTAALIPEWQVASIRRAESRTLVRDLGITQLVAELLCNRGLDTTEAAERYFNPSLDQISEPSALTDMEAAVDRIRHAARHNQRVLVFGDYDVDGVSGTATLATALRQAGLEQVETDLPQRLNGGYGLNVERVDRAAEEGVDLIITVDNGASAWEEAARARTHGIDFIVTDHHAIGPERPDALAVINPQQEPEDHPARRISGSAVAWKLAWALTGDPRSGLDLVALGSVADVMPLQGENRSLVALGIDTLRNLPRLGMMELCRVSNIPLERLTSEQIAFQLAPRLNASGRLGDARAALELLLTEDPIVAMDLAATLDETNKQRRALEAAMFNEAIEQLESHDLDETDCIVLARRGWHPGVVGIVSSRLMRHFHKPAVLIAVDDEGIGRGSARSIPGLHIADALAACTEHLVRHGGHGAAGGLTIEEGRVPHFAAALNEFIGNNAGDAQSSPVLHIDGQVSLSTIDSQLIRLMDQLQPFGNANPAPVFCTYGASVVEKSVRIVGGDHVKLSVQEGPRVFEAMAFGMAARFDELAAASSVDIAFSPQLNTFRGETNIQLMLKDIRVHR